ncbi:outer membrane beta-barrel protein [Microbulbifer bruguierae]|uniref:Outer membrane beta-barrel protein n=1 Tax=Microbulbifer bruguierae TaxID=3029061 RepID=A0ABY8N8W6_9GAMM|nr:outer membrane beta-barrel protein [Microbulbifer bruguierae]WGL15238.1 outer membrane beta-barrel protein [Microbulbifer bruguierae]
MKVEAAKVLSSGLDSRKSVLWTGSAILCVFSMMGQSANAITIDLPGNIELTSSARVEAQYDDNVFLAAENGQGDWVTRISPNVRWEREGRASSLSGSFLMTRGYYRNGTRQSFSDYAVNLDWQWRALSFLEVQISGSYLNLAQSVSGAADGSLDPILIEADRTRQPSAEVALMFGRQGGRLQAAVRQGQRNYEFQDPSREFTDVYSIFSSNYSLNDQFILGLQVTERALDYADVATTTPNRDSDEWTVLATGEYRLPKTRVLLRAGRLNRAFAAGEREDFEGPRWDLTASWSPKSYSTLSVTTGKNVQESFGVADFIDVKSNVFSWSHQWVGNLNSVLSYSRTTGEFVGEDRLDEVFRSSFTIEYLPVDWLRLSLGVSKLENHSSATGADLENNRYILGIEAPL